MVFVAAVLVGLNCGEVLADGALTLYSVDTADMERDGDAQNGHRTGDGDLAEALPAARGLSVSQLPFRPFELLFTVVLVEAMGLPLCCVSELHCFPDAERSSWEE